MRVGLELIGGNIVNKGRQDTSSNINSRTVPLRGRYVNFGDVYDARRTFHWYAKAWCGMHTLGQREFKVQMIDHSWNRSPLSAYWTMFAILGHFEQQIHHPGLVIYLCLPWQTAGRADAEQHG